ncbi:MAG: molybdenum cofactor guanylyltransferase [Anaerolineae bacterium]|nr:molybdenum cofactor guanylyltransferase [Anaerolineae bacterium]
MVSIAILAGGQSRRMGRDKAFLEVGGLPIMARVLAQVEPLSNDVFISTNSPEKYAQFGLRLVADVCPLQAVLGGIYSALAAARYHHLLVVACDMPFLQADLLQHLIDLAPTADAVVPLLKASRPEVLHAVYSKRCLPAIRVCLQNNRLRVIDMFAEITVRYVERDEIAKFDPNFYSFINLNTPADWQRAQALAGKLS